MTNAETYERHKELRAEFQRIVLSHRDSHISSTDDRDVSLQSIRDEMSLLEYTPTEEQNKELWDNSIQFDIDLNGEIIRGFGARDSEQGKSLCDCPFQTDSWISLWTEGFNNHRGKK